MMMKALRRVRRARMRGGSGEKNANQKGSSAVVAEAGVSIAELFPPGGRVGGMVGAGPVEARLHWMAGSLGLTPTPEVAEQAPRLRGEMRRNDTSGGLRSPRATISKRKRRMKGERRQRK